MNFDAKNPFETSELRKQLSYNGILTARADGTSVLFMPCYEQRIGAATSSGIYNGLGM